MPHHIHRQLEPLNPIDPYSLAEITRQFEMDARIIGRTALPQGLLRDFFQQPFPP